MPVEFKDYYKVLGVERTASGDDIRKAFRKLARIYHPDVAKDKKGAEEKFKGINEAYEVLGDPEKRKKYDELGADWKDGGARPGPGGQAYRTHTWRTGDPRGEDFEVGGTGFSDFFEQFFGGGGGFNGGRGRGGFAAPEFEKGQDVEAVLMVTLEEAMKGGIRPITLRRGTGQTAATETHKVKIPPGIRDGQRLRLTGQGEPGAGGGPRGDLYLRVRMASHPDYRVEGGDLYYDLDLAPWEAALGAKVSVPLLSGSPLSIKIPPSTQNGQRLRIKDRGLPGPGAKSGDLYVVARIQMPKEISEPEKALWEKLASESHFNPRS
jgi:curved DNA-binding protein